MVRHVSPLVCRRTTKTTSGRHAQLVFTQSLDDIHTYKEILNPARRTIHIVPIHHITALLESHHHIIVVRPIFRRTAALGKGSFIDGSSWGSRAKGIVVVAWFHLAIFWWCNEWHVEPIYTLKLRSKRDSCISFNCIRMVPIFLFAMSQPQPALATLSFWRTRTTYLFPPFPPSLHIILNWSVDWLALKLGIFRVILYALSSPSS